LDDAARRQPRPQSNWAQHGDIGALRERISGAERGIQSLSDQVGALQRDTTAQISGLSNAMAAQLASIGDKIDRQRDSATAARTTKWTESTQTAATVIAVVMSLVAAVIYPLSNTLSRHSDELEVIKATRFSKEDSRQMQDGFSHWIDKVQGETVPRAEIEQIKATVAESIRRLDARAEILLPINKERIDRLDKEIDHLQDDSVSRLENEAASRRTDERISVVIASMNELRHDFGASLTWGDALKELQSEIKELRAQAGAAAIALPTKPAP
jgi:hypothetical protein